MTEIGVSRGCQPPVTEGRSFQKQRSADLGEGPPSVPGQSMDAVCELLMAKMESLRKAIEETGRAGARPLLMTQTRVALEMSLSARTVKRMIARGELETVRSRDCRRCLVAASEVERWILEHTVRPDTRQKKRNPKTEAQKIRALAKS